MSAVDADRLAEANDLASKGIISGMNHVCKEAPLDRELNIWTYKQQDLPLKPELISAIAGV